MEDRISRGYSKYGSTATALQKVVKWRTPSDLNFVHYRVNWLFRRNSKGFVFLLRICFLQNTVLFPKPDFLEFLKYLVWLQRKKYVFQFVSPLEYYLHVPMCVLTFRVPVLGTNNLWPTADCGMLLWAFYMSLLTWWWNLLR